MFGIKELEETEELHFATKKFTVNEIAAMLEADGWVSEN